MKKKYVRLAVEYSSYNDKNNNSNNHMSKTNLQKDTTTSINNL